MGIIQTLTMTLQDTKELDDHLGRRADEDLALSPALSIDNIVQAVVLKKHEGGLIHKHEPLTKTETRTISF